MIRQKCPLMIPSQKRVILWTTFLPSLDPSLNEIFISMPDCYPTMVVRTCPTILVVKIDESHAIPLRRRRGKIGNHPPWAMNRLRLNKFMNFMITGLILRVGEILDYKHLENWKHKTIWRMRNLVLKNDGTKRKLIDGPKN
mmetsp:Transcript_66733/g.193243  ORF Transcript_66733/g.193243 Transcript_66733/m.193243 type:complete len:141 (-) Transcript_66733:616-1038(-)